MKWIFESESNFSSNSSDEDFIYPQKKRIEVKQNYFTHLLKTPGMPVLLKLDRREGVTNMSQSTHASRIWCFSIFQFVIFIQNYDQVIRQKKKKN